MQNKNENHLHIHEKTGDKKHTDNYNFRNYYERIQNKRNISQFSSDQKLNNKPKIGDKDSWI